MKKLSILPLAVILTGCLHESVVEDAVKAPVTPEAKIEYPPLADAAIYQALQTEAVAMPLATATAEPIIADFLRRVMSTLELANQEADIVATNSLWTPPVWKASAKPGGRKLSIITADNSRCDNSGSNQQTNSEALVWDDVNDDGLPLAGDKWYYIIENCENQSKSTFVTGVILYAGMSDPFNNQGLSDQSNTFSNYQYTLDIQINADNSNNAYFKGTTLTISRSENSDGAEITELQVNANALMGVKSADNAYLFVPQKLSAIADDQAQTLIFEYQGDYYQNTDGTKEKLTVVTEEPLTFSFDFHPTISNALENIQMVSGSLKFVGADNSYIVLSVNADETLKIQIDEDGDDTVDATFDTDLDTMYQQTVFGLVNIVGGG